jgi:hypothetical protein
MISVESRDDPRVGMNTDVPGTYFLAIQNLTKSVSQGKELRFQALFTGEGRIDYPKILLTPSSTIFDAERSIIRNNLSIVDDDSFETAASNNNFDPKGCTILLSRGQEHDEWELSTYFFDLNPQKKATETAAPISTNEVATDKRKLTSSPFTFALKSRKRTRPGNYTIDIQFTYFNGKEWKSDSKVIQFRVLNFFEKYIELIRFLSQHWFASLRSKLSSSAASLFDIP